MFDGFETEPNHQRGKRLAVTTGFSAAAYGAVACIVVFAASGAQEKPDDDSLEVRFAPPPPPPPVAPPPPPPAVPKAARVKKVAMVAPPTKLVEPQKISDKKLEEADPANDVIEVGEPGGTEVASIAPAPPPEPAPPPPPPPPPPKVSAPINLPENAQPPEPDGGNVNPEYPESARAEGKQGMVILKIIITAEGKVGGVKVLRGEEPFVSAAVAAVKTWHYTPALVEGKPRAVFRIIKVPFKLR